MNGYNDIYSISSFGINIGTGLMLESLLEPIDDRIDEDRVAPNKIKQSDYELYYINIDSFIQNVISSYEANTVELLIQRKKSVIDMVIERIVSELTLVKSLLDIEVIYYHCLYGSYVRRKAFKEHNPETKVFKIKKSIEYLYGLLKENKEVSIQEVDVYLPIRKKSLISTSNAVDLLNANRMELDLLEFHTGVLKKRNKFYTKLNTTSELPFEEVLLFALGDKKGTINSLLTPKEKKILTESISKKMLKPYKRYSLGFLIEITKDDNIAAKLKSLHTLF